MAETTAVSPTETMTPHDRRELVRVTRLRERVAKTTAVQRAAELMADFEAQLAARYAFDQDAVWNAAKTTAQQVVDDAQARVAARCQELGIPDAFAPSLSLQWWSRGENAVKERRQELRQAAAARIKARERTAKAEIERHSAELQTQILAGGLQTEEARAFLEAMPTSEALMPVLSVDEVEQVRLNEKQALRLALGYSPDFGAEG